MDEKDLAKKEEILSNYKGKGHIISSHDAKIRIAKQGINVTRFPSGFSILDEIMDGGAERGELIVVSAMSGQGKTTFCQSLTRNYAFQCIDCLWFTYEIPMYQFIDKFMDLPTFYIPQELCDNKLTWIEDRIIEAKVKYQVEVIFIDHLHYLVPLSPRINLSMLIGGIVRELKKMAIRHNIIIYLIAHTTKLRIEEVPGPENLRDSSFVVQESDFVLIIWRKRDEEASTVDEPVYLDEARLRVGKNRRTGRLGYLDLIWDKNLFRERKKL